MEPSLTPVPPRARLLSQFADVVPVGALVPHPRNPRRGNVPMIAASIRANGFYGRVIVQDAPEAPWTILAGEHRWRAAQVEGLAEVPIVRLPVTDAEALAIVLADNAASDAGDYDEELLLQTILAHRSASGTLEGTGYTDRDLVALQRRLRSSALDEQRDEVPADDELDALVRRHGVAAGQIWRIGDHRLAVGDSTDAALVARLLRGGDVACIWTDVPYALAYEGSRGAVTNDEIGETAVGALVEAALRTATEHVSAGAPVFMACNDRLLTLYAAALAMASMEVSEVLTWIKSRFSPGQCDYHYQHETVLLAYTAGERDVAAANPERIGQALHASRSVWRHELHPTQKPVDLVARHIEAMTSPRSIVYDPFAGSLTTLVACQQTSRRARCVEISPRYAAGGIERAARLGLAPVRIHPSS